VTDADLVARAQRGDAAAFGELVTRHQMAVYRAALAALGSPSEAEDAAQEAFIKAYTRLESFRGNASFKTWLLTIVWNEAINRRRVLNRWWKRTVQIENGCGATIGGRLETNAASPLPTPEQAVAHDEMRRDIRREILALSPKLRDALLLAQSEDYTYEEVGAMLRVPLGTIKWRVSEARRIVKQRLRARGYTDVG
jgi:RNA polymerase sigma-70 factor (ECF subfamily)